VLRLLPNSEFVISIALIDDSTRGFNTHGLRASNELLSHLGGGDLNVAV
jgi:hypothetical protein